MYYFRIFNTFLLTTQIKNCQMLFAIFRPIRHCGLYVTCNSYGYIQAEAVDRIIACVAKRKSYARILNTFFLLVRMD